MSFRSTAQSLLLSEDFRALFEDEKSPVREEIARLRRRCEDPNVKDHLLMLHIKWRLEGMLAVLDLVQRAAKEEDESSALEPPNVLTLGQRVGKYAFRRGLMG